MNTTTTFAVGNRVQVTAGRLAEFCSTVRHVFRGKVGIVQPSTKHCPSDCIEVLFEGYTFTSLMKPSSLEAAPEAE